MGQVTELSPDINYRPRFPKTYKPGIGLIGCGGIARAGHLPSYAHYGVPVLGVYDISAEATRGVVEDFGVERVYEDLDDLLADPQIEVVDIATRPEGREELIRRALAAGKHVLAQKPFALDLAEAAALVQEADRAGLRLAVNQNARWDPHWRIATLLIENGTIGEVVDVTHLLELSFGSLVGTWFDTVKHFAIVDYAIHFIDITRCWTGTKAVRTVRAREYRMPNQPPESQAPWGTWIEMDYTDGTNGSIRCVGGAQTSAPGHFFWIHGSKGTIKGSILGGDFIEVDSEEATFRLVAPEDPMVDRFAGAMGELLCAIDEEREPFHAARHNLLSLEMMQAACLSAESNGQPVAINAAS